MSSPKHLGRCRKLKFGSTKSARDALIRQQDKADQGNWRRKESVIYYCRRCSAFHISSADRRRNR